MFFSAVPQLAFYSGGEFSLVSPCFSPTALLGCFSRFSVVFGAFLSRGRRKTWRVQSVCAGQRFFSLFLLLLSGRVPDKVLFLTKCRISRLLCFLFLMLAVAFTLSAGVSGGNR